MSETYEKNIFSNGVDSNERLMKFIEILDACYAKVDDDSKKSLVLLKKCYVAISERAKKIDEVCYFTRKRMGDSVVRMMDAVISDGSVEGFDLRLEQILTSGFCFLTELSFRCNPGQYDFEELMNSLLGRVDSLANYARPQTVWAVYAYPNLLAADMLKRKGVSKLIDIEDKLGKAAWSIHRLDDLLQNSETQIEIINNKMGGLKDRYNFVELNQGFAGLRRQKRIEIIIARIVASIFGILMLVLPILQITMMVWGDSIFGSVVSEKFTKNIIYIAPALVTGELIILYFFRVCLVSLREVRAQILQLDLRVALCQFIRGYSEQNKNIDDNQRKSLEKFESVIFSGIANEGSAIPTTFDGLSEVAKLIQSLNVAGKKNQSPTS